MNKNIIILTLLMATLALSGCKKNDEEIPVTPEIPDIISDTEVVNEDGYVVVESVFDDESKMYFILLDAVSAAVTNSESFYGSGNNNYGYQYRGDVVIPSEITHLGETYTITTIGKRCFADTRLLKSVDIPHTVTSIEREAFINSGIRSIVIPESISELGWCIFRGCKALTSVTLPDSLESIGSEAFNDCDGLTMIAFPEALKNIGHRAFIGCDGLTSITIPESVNSIGENAFKNCSKLKEVNYNAIQADAQADADIFDSDFNKIDSWFYGCSALETINIGDQVEAIPSYSFVESNITSVNIGNSVKCIDACAFMGCKRLPSITIPESVMYIGAGAFGNCTQLTSITIPNSVCYLGGTNYAGEIHLVLNPPYSGAFSCCTNLSSVTIGNSVEEIGEFAFYGCSNLESIVLPNSVKKIGGGAFERCTKLTTVILPNSVQTFGACGAMDENLHGVFTSCTGLTSVTLGNSIERIGEFAFYGCNKLENIVIPNSVIRIGGGAFANCSKLTSVNLPNSVRELGYTMDGHGRYYGAFTNCTGLISVTFGNSIEEIGIRSFYGCSNLENIVIPQSVKLIRGDSFSQCGLVTVTCLPIIPPTSGDEGSVNFSSPQVIRVPAQSVDLYREEWWFYEDIIEGI